MCFRSSRRRGHCENSSKTKLHPGSSSFVCSENSGSCVFPTIYRRVVDINVGHESSLLFASRRSCSLVALKRSLATVAFAPREPGAATVKPRVCQQQLPCSLFLLVPGFSTASYLKVHIKTHHGSPLPPSSTMHTYPEPRGELQMHNGNPYHMGRQCSVEGKQPRPRPFPTLMRLAFQFASLLCRRHVLLHPVVCLTREHTSPSAAKLPAATASVRCLLQLTGCVFTLEEAV